MVSVQLGKSGNARTAEIKALWEIELEVEGEAQHVALNQTLSLKVDNGNWKFVRFGTTKAQ
jgi:hypothetical protein